eukprot:7281916-Prorocentrum_lima.AAC.1
MKPGGKKPHSIMHTLREQWKRRLPNYGISGMHMLPSSLAKGQGRSSSEGAIQERVQEETTSSSFAFLAQLLLGAQRSEEDSWWDSAGCKIFFKGIIAELLQNEDWEVVVAEQSE